MRKMVLLLSFFLIEASLAKTCDIEFKKFDLCGEIQFEKEVNRKSSSDFVLKLTKKHKIYLPKEKLNIYLHMKMKNGHHHGSSDVMVMKRKEDYLIQDVWFIMNGLWQIHFELRQKDKVLDKAVYSVCVGDNCRDIRKIKMH